jgi:hypothetical protein
VADFSTGIMGIFAPALTGFVFVELSVVAEISGMTLLPINARVEGLNGCPDRTRFKLLRISLRLRTIHT